MTADEGYAQFRGKCRELSEAAVAADPSLRLARGWYTCPLWRREEQHWWTVRTDGSIYDPSAAQFPSNGSGFYREYDGTLECHECGKEIAEADAIMMSRYPVCSYNCARSLVGV